MKGRSQRDWAVPMGGVARTGNPSPLPTLGGAILFQSALQSELPPFRETSEAPFCFSPETIGRSLHFVTLCKPRVSVTLSDWPSGLGLSSCHFLPYRWERLDACSGAGGAQMFQDACSYARVRGAGAQVLSLEV